MTAAADEFEIVIFDTAAPASGIRGLVSRASSFTGALFSRGASPVDESGMIVSVRHKETGAELFRHIEDDDGHMLHDIEQDLESMTADEFKAAWGSGS